MDLRSGVCPVLKLRAADPLGGLRALTYVAVRAPGPVTDGRDEQSWSEAVDDK